MTTEPTGKHVSHRAAVAPCPSLQQEIHFHCATVAQCLWPQQPRYMFTGA